MWLPHQVLYVPSNTKQGYSNIVQKDWFTTTIYNHWGDLTQLTCPLSHPFPSPLLLYLLHFTGRPTLISPLKLLPHHPKKHQQTLNTICLVRVNCQFVIVEWNYVNTAEGAGEHHLRVIVAIGIPGAWLATKSNMLILSAQYQEMWCVLECLGCFGHLLFAKFICKREREREMQHARISDI